MNRNILPLLFVLLALLTSCASKKLSYRKLSSNDKSLADTLIKQALENEGLFTVTSRLKPISSVQSLYLQISTGDSTKAGTRNITDTSSADFQKLKRFQKVVNTLQFGDLSFMMSPYNLHDAGRRVLQITIHRQSLMDSLILANQSFYGQFGIVPGINPQLVVNTTEYEEKYNRLRSYGYLFGYPEHAVAFFLDAAISENRKGKRLNRDFFQIPVYSSATGHFVYAIPKGEQPGHIDSAIYKRATYHLTLYKAERQRFTRKDGSVNYYKLLHKLIRTDER